MRLCFPRFDLLQPFLLCIREGSGKIAAATSTCRIFARFLRSWDFGMRLDTTTIFLLIPYLQTTIEDPFLGSFDWRRSSSTLSRPLCTRFAQFGSRNQSSSVKWSVHFWRSRSIRSRNSGVALRSSSSFLKFADAVGDAASVVSRAFDDAL